MPEITSGNTMAPCVVIGERAADMIAADHALAAVPDAPVVPPTRR
jgi:choline dehydrogenase